jgi:hypothetical protein
MSLTTITLRARGIATPAAGVLLATLLALAAVPGRVQAQPPLGPTELAAEEKVGVTLYQASGLTGKIPLKKVQVVHPTGDTSHYELQFASSNMNTKMEFQAKFVVPAGMVFKSFEIFTFNGPTSVTPAGADSWDGQTIIDKVTISPWNMNHVLEQCVAHLKQADGSYKSSATFDLEASLTELVRGKGIATFPNAPPGSASSYSAEVKPRTRVTAYIVEESRRSEEGRPMRRLSGARPAEREPIRTIRPARPAPQGGSGSAAPATQATFQAEVLSPLVRKPQSSAPRRLTASPSSSAAKETFQRKKPHVNVP